MFLLGSFELFQLILDLLYCSNKIISMIHRTWDCILNNTLVRQFFVTASCLVHCGYQIACLCHRVLACFCRSWKNQSVSRYSILRTKASKNSEVFFHSWSICPSKINWKWGLRCGWAVKNEISLTKDQSSVPSTQGWQLFVQGMGQPLLTSASSLPSACGINPHRYTDTNKATASGSIPRCSSLWDTGWESW